MKVLFDNEKMGGNDKMFDNKVICPTDGDSEDSNSEDVIDIIDIQQNTGQSTSIQNKSCYQNNQHHLTIKDFV